MKKYICIYILSFLHFGWVAGQVCSGNLGENIFTEGDFGSGSSNILPQNPNIAPGYIYQFQPPPNDGYYTISNNTSPWAHIFGWVRTGDASPDPRGYMMIVNATFSPGFFYEQEVDNLCANTLYEFSVDLFNLVPSGSNFIKPNVSFLIDGIEVYNTGDVPENEKWNKYGFTFTTAPGQTSVTLSLKNKAPGGTGNDLALDNIAFRPCGPEAKIFPQTIVNICENGNPIDLEATVLGTQYDNPQFQWQLSTDDGMSWMNLNGGNDSVITHSDLIGGLYIYRYLLANDSSNLLNSKCRVVSNEKLVNVVPKYYTIIDTICEGISFQLGNKNLDVSGVYQDSLQSVFGCDSVVTLELTVLPNPGIEVSLSLTDPVCFGESTGKIQLDSIQNGFEPYQVFFENELSNQTLSRTNLSEGVYELNIIDRFGCQLFEEIQLNNPIPLSLDLGPDQNVILGETVTLVPILNDSVTTFDWQSSGTLDCTDCPQVRVSPTQGETVYLEVKDELGCRANDSISFSVDNVRKVFIPNAFSPNGDGINDVFMIFGDIPNVAEIESLQIFGRWGELIFEKKNFLPNDEAFGWNGYFKNKKMDPGVYVYLTQIKFLDGITLAYSGSLSLVR
jgi:gliding motility-associated-like protein